MEIKAAVSREAGKIETLQIEDPRENEIFVRLIATGIFHTDVSVCKSSDSMEQIVLFA